MYHNVLVKKLSGGTKRKLSVAIALLGEPASSTSFASTS